MATIKQRIGKNNKISYLIRVSLGYENGKHIEKSMTWTPGDKMTKRQIQKELERQAVLFENSCKEECVSASVKFKEFVDLWFEEYAKLNLKRTTVDKLYIIAERVCNAIGDTPVNKLTVRQIQMYINSLAQKGANMKNGAPLSQKTIKNHLGFIYGVLNYAVKMDMLPDNICRKITVPKGEKKEKPIYSEEEMIRLLMALESAPLRYKTFFYLLSHSGFRKGEMLGLEWSDVDFDNCIVSVNRTSNHTTRHGTFTDTPKTKGSRRSIKIPKKVVELLKQLQAEQKERAVLYGSKWETTERVFTGELGGAMGYGAPYNWLKKFCKRNDLPFYGIHTFRHFIASILITGGTDVTTVSRTLGHSNSSTTLNIYSHMFQKAQARAAETIENALDFKAKENILKDTKSAT